MHFNTLKPNEISYSYQLDQSISVFRTVGLYFHFYSDFELANNGEPYQTPLSDLGLHCFSMSHKKTLGLLLSRDMGFPTMWYVRPAKAQTSLCIRAV